MCPGLGGRGAALFELLTMPSCDHERCISQPLHPRTVSQVTALPSLQGWAEVQNVALRSTKGGSMRGGSSLRGGGRYVAVAARATNTAWCDTSTASVLASIAEHQRPVKGPRQVGWRRAATSTRRGFADGVRSATWLAAEMSR